jgi:diphosphomevalonate decarboxylase
MNHHPYREGRIKQANDNIKKLIPALKTADWNTIAAVSEEEACSLHGLMMSSNPSYVLLEPESLRIIQRIRHWRSKYNKPIFFSIDAGPNIHVLFPSKIKDEVKEWIRNDLNEYNENDRIIFDKAGTGPTKLV